MNVATLIFGPLAGPECRRSVARGWLILARAAAAVALFGAALVALWVAWLNRQLDPFHQPYYELRIGLAALEGMLVTIALVLGPAVMAGSLAGERERGALGLLLTTRVSAAEIVAGRLAGKSAQVGMIVFAGFPAVVFLAALAGMSPGTQAMFLLLPAAVGLGGGGLAAVASVVSRRGRDALLAVYLVDLFFLLTPLSSAFGLPRAAFDWVSALNPYIGLEGLVFRETVGGAWMSIGLWLAVGLAGASFASWRLRPSCLAPLDGERVGRKTGRRGRVPPVDEARPMLWKELFIERVATLGRFGRWAGVALVAALAGGSLALTGVTIWSVLVRHDYDWADWARDQMEIWYGQTGGFLCCLVQVAVGLRASVAISSERERGTWDALLTSPLDGREIVRGKLWGSLYAIRWLIAATFLAWGLSAAVAAVPVATAVNWAAQALVVGAFMAAVGVRTSLACRTATRAMSLTIGIWLAAIVGSAFAAAVLLAAVFLVCNAVYFAAAQAGLVGMPATVLWFPLSMSVAWPLSHNGVYLLVTLLIVADTRLRFDRIAGRMTEGQLAVAFNDLVYGRPMDPVLFGPDGEPIGNPWPDPASAGVGDDGAYTGGDTSRRHEDPVAGSA